jgi:FKBP-type peptidyl-prolyl cis-trans isomerase SlyD
MPPSNGVICVMSRDAPVGLLAATADLAADFLGESLDDFILTLCDAYGPPRTDPAQRSPSVAAGHEMIAGMIISSPCVVSLMWRLEDAQGQLIDELAEPMEFLLGGDDLLAKVEETLIGQTTGFEANLNLEPDQAFGDYHAELVFFETRDIFPQEVSEGMQFDGPPEGSTTPDLPQDAIYTVTEVYDTHVVLDGNHPLAGLALRLDLKVCDVRKATEEEIEQGSVSESPLSVTQVAPPDETIH